MRRLMACWMLALLGVADPAGAQSEPYKVFDTRPVITQGPYLVATSGTTATVVWLTDTPSHSQGAVRERGASAAAALMEVVEPQRDGLVPVGTRHVVTLTGLEPGVTYSYQVVSTRVVALKAYWPDKGLSIESPVLAFTTLDPRKPTTSFSVVTRQRTRTSRAFGRSARSSTGRRPSSSCTSATRFTGSTPRISFPTLADADGGAAGWHVPLIYARGNHEMRGPFARQLFDYIPTPRAASISPATPDR